ncbi:hypothetical protein ECDEC8C_0844 [Escherichia coli DEC8C]|nr:hypothetical protein ECDEC8C_0844 [Escherichia coli DEC8C]
MVRMISDTSRATGFLRISSAVMVETPGAERSPHNFPKA